MARLYVYLLAQVDTAGEMHNKQPYWLLDKSLVHAKLVENLPLLC
jgi:hypothetical protein